jgi:DNA polymerase-3 subunit beta
MITFTKSQLRAALSHAAVKDIRYYLNGVLLEFTASGDIHIVATDGHRMFCGLIPAAIARWTDTPQKGPFSIIVPSDTVKTAVKGKGDITLSAMPDGRYSLGDPIFTPIDGKFPDWRRVIPTKRIQQDALQFNWSYIADAEKAIQTWHDSKPNTELRTYDGSGVMHGPDCTAFCVIMPRRSEKVADAFTPCAYG